MTEKIYLCSPSSDQSIAILRRIRKYKPRVEIVGVEFEGEIRLNNADISSFVSYRSIDWLSIESTVIPTGAASTKFFLERGDVFLGSIKMSAASLRVCDKAWLLSEAKNCGVLCPLTWTKMEDIVSFPVFYKEKFEQGGGTRGIGRGVPDLAALPHDRLIFQEYIDSPGTYGVSFLADDGKVLVAHAHFERTSYPSSGGSAVVIEENHDDRLLNQAKKLIAHIGYSGWGLAEFKFCPIRGDYVLMEINGKFWASCEFSFSNQPMFMKSLLNIDAKEIPTPGMIFVGRMLSGGFTEISRTFRYLLSSKFKLVINPGLFGKIVHRLKRSVPLISR